MKSAFEKSVDEGINLALGSAVVGYVGAAETARALRPLLGDAAIKEIERAMVSALDRMNMPEEAAARVNAEVRAIFARP